ncbi:MAG TPA: hypothetical protein EYN66_18500 [Myxococcales bacterium]|nr:hypothetical protein [Myxococcales bacterium]
MLRRILRLPLRVIRRLREEPQQKREDISPPPFAPPPPNKNAVGSSPTTTPVPTRAPVEVDVSETPNPNAFKFSVNQQVGPNSFSASSADAAKEHPLMAALFEIEGVQSIFGVNDFITVTKHAEAPWESMEAPLLETIKRVLSEG